MADMVRAVVQTGPRQMEMREFPRPVIGRDDGALLRVEACGICGVGRRAVQGGDGHPRAADDPRPRAARHHRGDRAGDRRPLGGQRRRPGGGGDPHPLPVLRPVPGRAATCSARTGPAATAATTRPSAASACGAATPSTCTCTRTRSCTRCAATSRPRSPSCTTRSAPACAGRLQYGGVHLGSSVLVLGAGQRGLAAILASRYVGAGMIIATGLDPRREEAGAGEGVRRGLHDQRRGRGHRRAGPRADRRRRRRRGARPHPDGAAADQGRDRGGPLGRHDRAGGAEGPQGRSSWSPTC